MLLNNKALYGNLDVGRLGFFFINMKSVPGDVFSYSDKRGVFRLQFTLFRLPYLLSISFFTKRFIILLS